MVNHSQALLYHNPAPQADQSMKELSVAANSLSLLDDTGTRIAATLLTNHYQIFQEQVSPILSTHQPSVPSRTPQKPTPHISPRKSPPSRTSVSTSPKKSPISGSLPKPVSSPTDAPADLLLYSYTLSFTRTFTDAEKKKRAERVENAKKSGVVHEKLLVDNPQPSPKAQRRLIYLLLKTLQERNDVKQLNIHVASDYNSFLVTCELLPSEILDTDHRVVLYGDYEHTAGDSPAYAIRVQSDDMKLTSLRALFDSQWGPSGDRFNSPDQKAGIVALNSMFSHLANHSTFSNIPARKAATKTRIGSNKFFELDPGATSPLRPEAMTDPAGLESRTGFFISVRLPRGPHASPLLNINATTSAFYPSGNLGAILKASGNPTDSKFVRTLEGVCVRTTHMRNGVAQRSNEALHIFSGLADIKNRQYTAEEITFRDSVGKSVTVYEYFKHNYPTAQVQKGDLLVLVDFQYLKAEKTTYIPAKLLEIVPGQVYPRPTEMIETAVRPPTTNRNLINIHGKNLFRFAEISNLFNGLSISQDMLQVRAYVLNAPAISYDKPVNQNLLQKGSWNLAKKQFATASSDSGARYSVLCLAGYDAPSVDTATLQKFRANLHDSMNGLGITATITPTLNTPEARQLRMNLPSKHSSLKTLEEAITNQFLEIQTNQKPKVIFVLLPEKDSRLYATVKRIGECELAIQTICHVCKWNTDQEKRFDYFGPKYDAQTLANLLLKFNLKLTNKGVNQKLSTKSPVLTSDTMLMGMDVTHASGTALSGAPSIAAVVGSIDKEFAQYPAVLRENQREVADEGQAFGKPCEEILDLEEMVLASIRKWSANNSNKTLPKRLIIYRDGLSEDQLESTCKKEELPRIFSALNTLYGEKKPHPEIILICTIKRHHTRFFRDDRGNPLEQTALFRNPAPSAKETKDKKNLVLKNPVAGTLVDNGVVLDEKNDFFLISHNVLGQGTARPTYYVVLRNDTTASKRELAAMTHSLCFLFGRSAASDSLATSSYYADLAADRARHYARSIYVPEEKGK